MFNMLSIFPHPIPPLHPLSYLLTLNSPFYSPRQFHLINTCMAMSASGTITERGYV